MSRAFVPPSLPYIWTCVKCGRKVFQISGTPRCCSEPMTNGARKTERKDEYKHYLTTAAWKQRAGDAKSRAGNRCQVCNVSGTVARLNTHHRTYERLGHERPEDLTVLCQDCHELFSKNGKLKL